MQVRRLRLSGFKSFVEPTEFPIEPGLTGVIGPNGCGKSNLLEALRWVMGASSAKAMRGEGMDDVIFSGAAGRAPRHHAEVTLTLDNPAGEGPAAFSADPVLEISRRIDRGEGSTYRINGTEVRARDVQLLFADASTGANSPSLVRQGQISELIAAKPQNRRRILEEAAGVSGLHGRRHEAQLRVRAAEANLTRLEDLAREVEGQLSRLRREARSAARYKSLAERIRKVQAALLHARWAEAAQAAEHARGEARAAEHIALETAAEAASATTLALKAEEALPPLRDEASASAAILGRLAIEADRSERELAGAVAEERRLASDLDRMGQDEDRESRIAADAARSLAQLETDLASLQRQIAAAPQRLPQLQTEAAQAESRRQAADQTLESLTAEAASRAAEARNATERTEEADFRLARAERALAQVRSERASLTAADTGALERAREAVEAAEAQEAAARAALELAETERAQAAREEAQARAVARAADDELAQANAATRGLAQALAAGRQKSATSNTVSAAALDEVSADAGYEAALAAAFGEDLDASLDVTDPAAWRGARAAEPAWPADVSPLGQFARTPPALAARLAWLGLVDRDRGDALAADLPVGARLVSREGDLWRWDGLTVRAEAPRPAQVRLEQRTQLAALEARVSGLTPKVEATRATHQQAAGRLSAADEAVRQARGGPGLAASGAARARELLANAEREAARSEARARMLDETIARFEDEQLQAAEDAASAHTRLLATPRSQDQDGRVSAARAAASQAREAAFAARSAADQESGAVSGRARRLSALEREVAEWKARQKQAVDRQEKLQAAREGAYATLVAARDAPPAIEARRLELSEQLASARRRQTAAADALAAAETARVQAERTVRAAEAAAGDAREARGVALTRLESAIERRDEAARAVRDASGLEPEALGRRVTEDATATPILAANMEGHLADLERELTAVGAVNLLAEEELAALTARLSVLADERADLAAALARLKEAIDELNAEGRGRLLAAFKVIDGHFRELFTTLFGGGSAELRLVESDDPLESGLEILASPPGKRMSTMSLMSGGEQALTAVALIFAVFLANPAPLCVLDEVDAPLDDANVERFCNLLDAMRSRATTRFLTITHNPLTMSRMDRLFGVTMREKGVSQLVSVDLRQAEALAAS